MDEAYAMHGQLKTHALPRHETLRKFRSRGEADWTDIPRAPGMNPLRRNDTRTETPGLIGTCITMT